MVILTTTDGSLIGSSTGLVRLQGLPDFNSLDWSWIVTDLGGWDDGAPVTSVLVPNGGGDGAVATAPWLSPERYYTVAGSVEVADMTQLESVRRLVLAAFPFRAGEAALQVLRPNAERQAFCRVYDQPTVEFLGHTLTFTLPLVAPDPYKYGLEPLTAIAGGFQSPDLFRVYTDDGSAFSRTYEAGVEINYRTYEGAEEESAFPKVARLESGGDQASRRVTITVTGPLSAGDWWVENVETGTRMWANVSLQAGQSIVFDSVTRHTTLSGANIDHLQFGDYLTLPPGVSSFRLITPSSGGANMKIEALEAWL